MDYSNESFEGFQKTLADAVPEDSPLWLLRDALFAEAFYGKGRQCAPLYHLPAGWLPVMVFLSWKGRRMRKHITMPQTIDEGAHHFLFLSARNNHTARLFPLYREHKTTKHCIAWCTQPAILGMARNDEKADFHCIAGRWTSHLRLGDIRTARGLANEFAGIFPAELDRRAFNAIIIYLVQFLAWERFWQSALGARPQCVVTTFEKVTHAKSFFHAALRKDCPRRIHWVHGLRHASIQATLATDLWCMTPGDIRFFKDQVPVFCTPSVKANPEARQLAETIGVLDLSSLPPSAPVHFLFLGPGKEASYTREMRMADLAIIRHLQATFGEKIHWRFRPHPSAAERFRAELAESGIEVADFSTGPLNDDLAWSHAVASSWSSLLLDVRETGRPIFWVQAEVRNLGAVDELIADGIGVHLDLEHGVERFMKTVGRGGASAGD